MQRLHSTRVAALIIYVIRHQTGFSSTDLWQLIGVKHDLFRPWERETHTDRETDRGRKERERRIERYIKRTKERGETMKRIKERERKEGGKAYSIITAKAQYITDQTFTIKSRRE